MCEIRDGVLCLVWLGYTPEEILFNQGIHVALRNYAMEHIGMVYRAFLHVNELTFFTLS